MARRFFKRYKKLEEDKSEPNTDKSTSNNSSKPKSNVGFFDLANNLSKALVEWQRAGRPVVSSEQWNKRLSICRSCEYWQEIKQTKIARCLKCGCSSGKLLLSTSKCPLNPPKWTSEI
tara:strand:+ start:8487 stop:8840 length:354 start_codon:yes stop_codon:yes gene_type:complete